MVEISTFCRIRSVATIWYGRITSSIRSAVSTQYFVRMFSRACLAKNVFANADKSVIGLFCASAHHDVNSKLFEVFRTRFDPAASLKCWRRVVLE